MNSLQANAELRRRKLASVLFVLVTACISVDVGAATLAEMSPDERAALINEMNVSANEVGRKGLFYDDDPLPVMISVSLDVDKNYVVVDMDERIGPRAEQAATEDLLDEIVGSILERHEKIEGLGVRFLFGGKPSTHWFPDPERDEPPDEERMFEPTQANVAPVVAISPGHGLYYHRTGVTVHDFRPDQNVLIHAPSGQPRWRLGVRCLLEEKLPDHPEIWHAFASHARAHPYEGGISKFPVASQPTPRDDKGENKHAKMPSVIVEVGFHTNPQDALLLRNREFQGLAMRGVAKGYGLFREGKPCEDFSVKPVLPAFGRVGYDVHLPVELKGNPAFPIHVSRALNCSGRYCHSKSATLFSQADIAKHRVQYLCTRNDLGKRPVELLVEARDSDGVVAKPAVYKVACGQGALHVRGRAHPYTSRDGQKKGIAVKRGPSLEISHIDPFLTEGVRSRRRPCGRSFTQVEPMDSYPSRQAIANLAFVIAPNVNVRAQGVGEIRHG